MSHDEPAVGGVISAAWGAARERRGTYAPILTGSGANPVLGELGFLTGKWWATGGLVTASIDLFINEDAGDPAGVIQGSSWRITLPFAADLSFHTASILTDVSDAIGNFQTRSGISAETAAGTVLMSPSVGDGERMIFYRSGSNSSQGAANFTDSARIKAIVHYVADHDAMEAALA